MSPYNNQVKSQGSLCMERKPMLLWNSNSGARSTLRRESLVKGSNAAALQKCFSCELRMPGLCFPKARRNTDEEEQCHGCRVDNIVRHQSGEVSWEVSFVLNNHTFNTIGDFGMEIFGVTADTYHYIKAPLDTKFNAVYPYSLINKKCKQDQMWKCSLRKA